MAVYNILHGKYDMDFYNLFNNYPYQRTHVKVN